MAEMILIPEVDILGTVRQINLKFKNQRNQISLHLDYHNQPFRRKKPTEEQNGI